MKVLIFDDSGTYRVTSIIDLVADDDVVTNMKGVVVDLPESFIEEYRELERKYWDKVKQLERIYEAQKSDLHLNQPK